MTASKRMLIRLKVKSMMEGRWLLINEIAVCPRTMDETGSMRGWPEKRCTRHEIGRVWKFRQEEVKQWAKSGGADGRRRNDDGWRAEN